ncbi:MAG: thioredoxin domain-containing protein [Anaerolineales bacterium]
MTAEIFERALLALMLIGAGFGACWLYNHVFLLHIRRRHLRLEGARLDKPLILYFTSPTCAPCHTLQRPAIQRLVEQLGETLQVVEVDVSQQPELARQWGIISVPSTIVLSASGEARYINHGVALAEKLLKQLNSL